LMGAFVGILALCMNHRLMDIYQSSAGRAIAMG
jgi:hypothetical protein